MQCNGIQYEPFFLFPGTKNGSPENREMIIYSLARLDLAGDKKMGPDSARVGPDWLNQPGDKNRDSH